MINCQEKLRTATGSNVYTFWAIFFSLFKLHRVICKAHVIRKFQFRWSCVVKAYFKRMFSCFQLKCFFFVDIVDVAYSTKILAAVSLDARPVQNAAAIPLRFPSMRESLEVSWVTSRRHLFALEMISWVYLRNHCIRHTYKICCHSSQD